MPSPGLLHYFLPSIILNAHTHTHTPACCLQIQDATQAVKAELRGMDLHIGMLQQQLLSKQRGRHQVPNLETGYNEDDLDD